MFLNSKTNLEALYEVTKLIEADIASLNKKVEENIPKVMPVGKYPSLSEFKWTAGSKQMSLNSYEHDWFKFYNYYGSEIECSSIEALDKRKAEIEAAIESLVAAQNKAEEENKATIANNILIREKIKLTMEHLGIADSYSVYELPSPRSRNKDWVKKTAGWVSDLNRCVPISLEGYKNDVSQLNVKVERLYTAAAQVVRSKEAEKKRKEEKAIAEHELALLRAKYCPDNAFALADDVMESLLSKNKYLMLAYHLQCTRNDWSEGFYMAQNGVDAFVVETDVDKEIEKELRAILSSSWEEDGRVFRDCEWNYNVLFGMVEDEALMADFQKLYAILDK